MYFYVYAYVYPYHSEHIADAAKFSLPKFWAATAIGKPRTSTINHNHGSHSQGGAFLIKNGVFGTSKRPYKKKGSATIGKAENRAEFFSK